MSLAQLIGLIIAFLILLVIVLYLFSLMGFISFGPCPCEPNAIRLFG